LSEAEVLASVIETYGTPAEIAEEYKSMEASLTSGPFPTSDVSPDEQRPFGFFNVLSDPRTYGALIFMLLALPTGIFYFVWTVVGISLSLSFAILIIGIPFALLFIGSIRVLAHVEGRIVEALLGVRMPRKLAPVNAGDETIWSRIKEALIDVRTWSSMFYLLLRLPLGIVYFVLAVVGLAVSIGITGGAITGLVTGHVYFQMDGNPYLQHFVQTAPGLLVLGIIGLLLFFVVLHVARGVGRLHARIAEVLLVRL
jgi:hypothetical protein